MYGPHSNHILPPMERNEGVHHEHKHQNKEDRREYWGAKGNLGVEGLEAGSGRVSDANEQGPERGGGDKGEGGEGGAGGKATRTDVHCHEADATSVRWLDQTG